MQFQDGIVRIMSSNGQVAGTGFFVSTDGFIATCAHVVEKAGSKPGSQVVVGLSDNENSEFSAIVESRFWRDPSKEDVAFLRLQADVPNGVSPLPMYAATLGYGRTFVSQGYRKASAFPRGLLTEGIVQGQVWRGEQLSLQLQTNQIEGGMSGAPIWSNDLMGCIGMISAYWDTRKHVDAWLGFGILSDTIHLVAPHLFRLIETESEISNPRTVTAADIDHLAEEIVKRMSRIGKELRSSYLRNDKYDGLELEDVLVLDPALEDVIHAYWRVADLHNRSPQLVSILARIDDLQNELLFRQARHESLGINIPLQSKQEDQELELRLSIMRLIAEVLSVGEI